MCEKWFWATHTHSSLKIDGTPFDKVPHLTHLSPTAVDSGGILTTVGTVVFDGKTVQRTLPLILSANPDPNGYNPNG